MFGAMALYPEQQIFDDKPLADIEPFFLYKAIGGYLRNFDQPLDRLFLEYYSSYWGKKSVGRPILKKEMVSVHLAARALGLRDLCAEQDAWMDRANKESGEVWDAIVDINTRIEPVFEGATYKGMIRAKAGEVAVGQDLYETNGGGVIYGGLWEKADGAR
ncbi:MAG: hypothetical protein NTW86_01390 [Candidatus Sumerlaeota bacterium]|nr:hypothetical protein [Candidatus Sumerlaeota bacterium]